MSIPAWTAPGQRPFTPPGPFLDLWRLPLDDSRIDQRFLTYLSGDESARADRFLNQSKRQQFIRARGWLRLVLSFYLNNAPSCIEFTYNFHGKPSLNNESSSMLKFNLSHSGDLALLAITSGAVGVDLEQIKPDLDYQEISNRFLNPGEQKTLASFELHRRRRGFYRVWTRKEALLKMVGCGFSVSAVSTANARLVRHIHVGSDYVAAVCCNQEPLQIRYYQLAPADLV